METDPFHVGEEAQGKEPQRGNTAQETEVAPLFRQLASLAHGVDKHLRHQQEQQRRHQQCLHQQEPPATGLESPGVAIHELEAQACICVLQIPCNQRRPSCRTQAKRHPDAWISQHASTRRQQQQRDEANANNSDEAIVAQRTHGQTHRKLRRRGRIHFTQQSRPGIQAQHGRHRHRHVRQGQDAQAAGQRHQKHQHACTPTNHFAKPARGNMR